MVYPGRAVRQGDPRAEVVREVQARLVQIGCGPLEPDGVFGAETVSAVKLFQTRKDMTADGVIGPLTWSELFQEVPAVVERAPSALLAATLDMALSQNGVREDKGRPNRGAQVDEYLRTVGLDPAGGYSWCQAFVYWCFAKTFPTGNPCVKTAGVLDHWAKSPRPTRVYAAEAFDDPRLVRPGAVFVVDHGSGRGHTGFVLKVLAGEVQTIEGNTNERGSREGDGVYQKTRSIASINVGFIDYGRELA
jgi:hypothetical protein